MTTALIVAGLAVVVLITLGTLFRWRTGRLHRTAGRRASVAETNPMFVTARAPAREYATSTGAGAAARVEPPAVHRQLASGVAGRTLGAGLLPDLHADPDLPTSPPFVGAVAAAVPAGAAAPEGPTIGSPQRAWLWSAAGDEFLLRDQGTHIGRASDNDVVLSDPDVSRHHAIMRYDDGTWWLLPELTRNGTYRNGRVVAPGERIALADGDVVTFGPVELQLRIPPARVAMRLRTLARTSPGQRRENQDAHLATAGLVAVADGVGGRPAGAVAARLAIRTCATAPSTASLAAIVAAAEQAIRDDADADPQHRGMAATLDVARLQAREDVWVIEGVHVGDGYAFLQDEEGVRALTAPDTVGRQLRQRDPQLAAALEPDSPGSFDDLVAALGFAQAADPQGWVVPAVAGQRLLVVSDGLVTAIGRDRILSELLVHRTESLYEISDRLLQLADNPVDNVTIVLAEVELERSEFTQLAAPSEVTAARLHRSERGRP